MTEPPQNLAESGVTVHSDSENYSSNVESSPSPPSSQSSPLILYSPPTIWGLLRGAAINLLLPFVNGLMLGFGELFAHEAAFRLGWSGTKVGTRPFAKLHMDNLWKFQIFRRSRFKPCNEFGKYWCIYAYAPKVFPSGRSTRSVGPGVEMRDNPMERRRRNEGLDDMTSLE